MPISNFRTLSFCIFCLSLTAFCHGQDSTKTLKSERYFYKGKLFKADYYNENGQRTLSWENDVGVYRHASNHLTFNSYDDPNIDRLSTRYYVKVKDEKTVKFLKESGKLDGIISATKTDSITGREYYEFFIFLVAKNYKKYTIEELPKLAFAARFDKIRLSECKGILIDSTATLKEYRAETNENTYHFYGAIYDSLGNYVKGYNKHFYGDKMYQHETETIRNTEIINYKDFYLPSSENRLTRHQRIIIKSNDSKQPIQKEFFRVNTETGAKKLEEKIEYEYFSDKLEKQTITRGRKKYVVEISRTYW